MSSFDAALYAYLSGQTSVGGRIYPMGQRPEAGELPAVTYQLVAGPTSHYSHGGVSDHMVSYQLDCWADDADEAMDVAEEVRLALDGYRGDWGTFRIGSAFLSIVFDATEPEQGLYRRMRQVELHYSEPTGS